MLPIYPDNLDYAYTFVPRRADTPRPPSPAADISFTPISHQLIYPTTRRVNQDGLDYYPASSQPLFPTPSELLSNITQRDLDAAQYMPALSQHTPDDAPNNPVNKTESQRKARQRAIAEEIGFTPTDPDTISSHEKKRHYLECLEQYVLYLHEQLRLVQTSPLTLERVSTYRGLSSRSIRTLLVHMQNTNKTLHEGMLVEEQVFLDLSDQVVATHSAGLPLRRHSVDVPGVSRSTGYNATLTSFDGLSSLPPEDITGSGSPSSADGNSTGPDTSADMTTHRFIFPSSGDGL